MRGRKKGTKLSEEAKARMRESYWARVKRFVERKPDPEYESSTEEQLIIDWRDGFFRDDFRELFTMKT